jgi:hypothetical protein
MKLLKLNALILCASILAVQNVFAGPPFNTDDPEPVAYKHWEYYLSSIHTIQPNFIDGTLPHFEMNYGIVANGQFHILIPLNYNLIRNKEFNYGYALTELGFKYRFYHNEEKSFQIGTFPIVEIPTIRNTNFSNNKVQVYLPIWIQKSWDKLTTYGGFGYWINPGDQNKNWSYLGWELQYDYSSRFILGGELFYRTSSTVDGTSMFGLNLGGFINFSDKFHVIYSFGHSLDNSKTFMSYIGLLWTI